MTWKGFYINLDRAAGRRSSIESQLDALGLKQFYRRFPAVDGRLLGVPHLLIDKHPRVGDQWRSRYKSLTLHDPVWYDHMPYLPFPDHWPVYTPKDKGVWEKIKDTIVGE